MIREGKTAEKNSIKLIIISFGSPEESGDQSINQIEQLKWLKHHEISALNQRDRPVRLPITLVDQMSLLENQHPKGVLRLEQYRKLRLGQLK